MPLPWFTVNGRISMQNLNEGLNQLHLLLEFLKNFVDILDEKFVDINFNSLIALHSKIKSSKVFEIESWQD